MARTDTVLTSFSTGEISSDALGRVDLKQYLNGCFKLRNYRQLSEGGVTTRPGTRLVAEMRARHRIEPFEFSEDQAYLMALRSGEVSFFQAPGFPLSATLSTDWTQAVADELDYSQAGDTMIVAHKSRLMQKIVRTAANAFQIDDWEWEIAADGITIRQPYYKFPDNVVLVFSSITAGASICGTYRPGGITPVDDFWQEDHVGLQFQVKNTDGTKVRFSIDSLAGAGALQNANVTLHADVDADGTGTPDWSEPLFSAVRGWPSAVTFGASRLWLSGPPSRPACVVASKIDAFFNFDVGKGEDSDAIDWSIAGEKIREVRHIVHDDSLMIFTDGGEFYVKIAAGNPITPSTMNTKLQSSYGAKAYVKPHSIDGAVLYVQKGSGSIAREFVFKDSSQRYESDSLSLLSKGVVDNAQSMAVQTNRWEEQYAFIVNGDGSLAILLSIRNEKLLGWSRWTPGAAETYSGSATMDSQAVTMDSLSNYFSQIRSDKFLDVATVGKETFVMSQRKIAGEIRYFIERFDETVAMDLVRTIPGTGLQLNFGGLYDMVGATMAAVSRNRYMGLVEITASGDLELNASQSPVTSVEVGFPFEPLLTPTPFDGTKPNGATLTGRKRRVAGMVLHYRDTLNLVIGRQKIALQRAGSDPSEQPKPKSGFVPVRRLGYGRAPTISITQDEPLPATILGLHVELGY